MTEAASGTGAQLWRRMLRRPISAAPLSLPLEQIERAMAVAPPSLVAAALAAGSDISAAAKASADYGRYVLSRQMEVLRWLEQIGAQTVALKGMAAALCDWPDPAQRIVGDLDLLVRREDLPRIVDALSARGFRFGGALQPRWGFLSDASFVPFYSPDAVCNVDLHIEPDSYPLHRGLDAQSVFAAARAIHRNGMLVRVPSAEHALLIAVANLAKDKFPVSDARKIIDIGLILQRGSPFDWREVEERARQARLGVALRTALSLVVALGLDDALVPVQWRAAPPPPRRGAWRDLLDAWLAFDRTPAGVFGQLRREWLLSASPTVAVQLGLRRLRGLLRPRSGVPVLPPRAGEGQRSTPREF